MLKKISKKLIIFSSLFLTFFCFQNVFALNPFEFTYGNQNPTGFELENAGFDENGLFFDFSYSDSYTSDLYSYYDYDWNVSTLYFPAHYYEELWYRGIKIKDLVSGQTLIINEFECVSSKKNYINDAWSRESAWCSLTETGSLRLYVKSMRFPYSQWGDQLSAYNGYAFSENELNSLIPNFFNSDGLSILELNSNFVYISGDYVNDSDSWSINYPNGANISSFFSGVSQELTNGSCGSDADIYSFYDNPPTNLCSTGTSDNFTFNGLAYQTGSTWTWDCLGENGGSDTSCVSYLDPNSKIDGICGDYANQDFQTVEDFNGFSPYNTYHKCSQGLYNSTSFVASVNTVSWYCTGINYGISAFCTANLITPTTDAFDYSDYEIPDFYEDLTDKGWFVQAMAWLFLPTPETLNDHNNIFHEFRGKAPLGYVAKFHDFFMSIVSESPEPIPFPELVVTPFAGTEPVTFFNFVSFVEIVGADNFSRFYHFLELLIGAVVIGYLVRRGIRFAKELK